MLKALNIFVCADVPLSNYSLTHLRRERMHVTNIVMFDWSAVFSSSAIYHIYCQPCLL